MDNAWESRPESPAGRWALGIIHRLLSFFHVLYDTSGHHLLILTATVEGKFIIVLLEVETLRLSHVK